jgi:hypothetical protein
MSRPRASSFPDLVPVMASNHVSEPQPYDDSALEGVAAHIKLLLKLTQDHKEACDKEKNDKRRMLRVATMMTILDNVRDRIQKCQSFGSKKNEPELRRCNTDLRRNALIPKEKKPANEPVVDEKEKLRRQLSASLAARKSLEIMCSSLGKEKMIMSGELSKKIFELRELEELVSDLKNQNEVLLGKVQEYAENSEKPTGNTVLQERNKSLSEHLLRSLEGYKSMKRKVKEVREENVMLHGIMDEMGEKVGRSLERVRSFKEKYNDGSDTPVDVQEEIGVLENMLEGFKMAVDKHDQRQGECVMHKGEISVSTHSVLA